MTTSVASARAAATALPAIVVIGPLPPPWHGGAVATSFVLRSAITQRGRVLHLDTTDRRGLDNIGRVDAGNVLLALRHCAELLRLLITARPRVVYLPLALNRIGLLRDAAFVLPALVARRRVVLHLHGSGLRDLYDAADPLTRALIRLMLGRAARVIVLGESLRAMVDGLAPAERVAVLPNGIDDPFGDAPAPRREAAPLRVLCLGNLRRAKGYLDAVEAVRLLRARDIPVELHLAGGFSSEADRTEGMRAIEPLGAVVVLHGVVEGAAKRRLLEAADVFVCPSHSEGHPYVVLEAMAAGLPVISTSLPALAETVIDGETGLLVPPAAAGTLARAIETLARDPDLRIELGRAGRRRFEERYAFAVWSRGLERIVAGVLS